MAAEVQLSTQSSTSSLDLDDEGFEPFVFKETRWFAGRMPRVEAQARVERGEVEGAFLIRESESRQGEFTLTLFCSGKGHHVKVLRDTTRFWLDPRKRFGNIEELVAYYTANSLQRHFNSLPVALTDRRGTTVLPNVYKNQKEMEEEGLAQARVAAAPAPAPRPASTRATVATVSARPRSLNASRSASPLDDHPLTRQQSRSTSMSSEPPDESGDFAIMFMPPDPPASVASSSSSSHQPHRPHAHHRSQREAAAVAEAVDRDCKRLGIGEPRQRQVEDPAGAWSALQSTRSAPVGAGHDTDTRSRNRSWGRTMSKSFLLFRKKNKKALDAGADASAASSSTLRGRSKKTRARSNTSPSEAYRPSISANGAPVPGPKDGAAASTASTSSAAAGAADTGSRTGGGGKKGQKRRPKRMSAEPFKQVQQVLQGHAMALLQGKDKQAADVNVANAIYLLLAHSRALVEAEVAAATEAMGTADHMAAALAALVEGRHPQDSPGAAILSREARKSLAWLKTFHCDDRQAIKTAKRVATRLQKALKAYDTAPTLTLLPSPESSSTAATTAAAAAAAPGASTGPASYNGVPATPTSVPLATALPAEASPLRRLGSSGLRPSGKEAAPSWSEPESITLGRAADSKLHMTEDFSTSSAAVATGLSSTSSTRAPPGTGEYLDVAPQAEPLSVSLSVAGSQGKSLTLQVVVKNGPDAVTLDGCEFHCGGHLVEAETPATRLEAHGSRTIYPVLKLGDQASSPTLKVEYCLAYHGAARGRQVLAGQSVIKAAKRTKHRHVQVAPAQPLDAVC